MGPKLWLASGRRAEAKALEHGVDGGGGRQSSLVLPQRVNLRASKRAEVRKAEPGEPLIFGPSSAAQTLRCRFPLCPGQLQNGITSKSPLKSSWRPFVGMKWSQMEGR